MTFAGSMSMLSVYLDTTGIVDLFGGGLLATVLLVPLFASFFVTRSLMRENGIAPENVGFHGKIPGESSKCPGRKFPHDRLAAAIA